jgi:hypothetical protein
MAKAVRKNKSKRASATENSAFCSFFAPDAQDAIRASLPPKANSDAVLRAYTELANNLILREIHDRGISPAEWRARWEKVEKATLVAAEAINRVRSLQTAPDACWHFPVMQELRKTYERARTCIVGCDEFIEANTYPKNSFHTLLYSSILRIWTDVAGGELKISRSPGPGELPGGPLIRHISLMLRLFDVPVPGSEGLAKIVKIEKKRRAHTQREAEKLPKLPT